MKIGFVNWGLFTTKGGAERFCVQIAHAMLQRAHECLIFYKKGGTDHPMYPIPAGVRMCGLELHGAASLERDRQRICETDLDVLCAISANAAGLHILVPLLHTTGIPLLASEHNVPQAIETYDWNRAERLAYMTAADGIHLLDRSFLASLPEDLRARATAIPNPAPPPAPVDWSRETSPRKCLLAVSKLNEGPKQLSLLIQAFSLLAEDFPAWDCCICGDGLCRGVYADMIRDGKLEERIQLAGAVDNVDDFYAASHLFCMPSSFEGFPIALMEAQSHALPSVGFADCTGVNEIIIHEENGLLVQQRTVTDLAAGLRQLMGDPHLRRRMGERAQALLSRYDQNAVFDQWEDLFRKLATAKNRTRLDNRHPLEDGTIDNVLDEVLQGTHMLNHTVKTGKRRGSANSIVSSLRAKLSLERVLKRE